MNGDSGPNHEGQERTDRRGEGNNRRPPRRYNNRGELLLSTIKNYFEESFLNPLHAKLSTTKISPKHFWTSSLHNNNNNFRNNNH